LNLVIIDGALARLGEIVDGLGARFPPPQLAQYQQVVVDRYEDGELSDGLFRYLKAVKAVSTLNAAVLLVSKGYAQEANALCRVAEEQTEDINFILFPRGESGEPSERQIQMIEEFFQEEFADPTESDPAVYPMPLDAPEP
jgi:hypothetical protein